MSSLNGRVRVLYSFPHKLGAGRICYTAWQQVKGIAEAGADVLAFPGAVHQQLPGRLNVKVQPTLARGRLRIPYKLIGSGRALILHDAIVARRLRRLAGQVDIVHAWPLGARRTLKIARELSIPTVLERCNAHTGFAYEVVQNECDRLGVKLPRNYEHVYNAEVLRIEEEEYQLADALLCPSDFVVKTFRDKGFPGGKLVRHTYGFDEGVYYPDPARQSPTGGLTALFVGVCAVRKGLHFALEAWLRSSACRMGTFLIAGDYLPAYADKLRPMLSHPSVRVLGHRNDVPELMRKADILVLPSIEEGYGLVIAEAMGSGCVPLASDACTEICRHMETGLVHHVGDVDALTQHINMLDQNRALLGNLRAACLREAPNHTWTAAGARLVESYREVIAAYRSECLPAFTPEKQGATATSKVGSRA